MSQIWYFCVVNCPQPRSQCKSSRSFQSLYTCVSIRLFSHSYTQVDGNRQEPSFLKQTRTPMREKRKETEPRVLEAEPFVLKAKTIFLRQNLRYAPKN